MLLNMSHRLRRAVRRRVLRSVGVDARPWPRVGPAVVARPPEVDEIVGPPAFVGIGSQKCGTSWWHSLLNDHPDVVASVAKELHYFDRYFDDQFGHEDIAGYHALFPCRAGQLCGEWTPRYIADPWAPALLAEAAPEAKILVLLRDPVQRYVSGITHDLARGAPNNPIVANIHIERGDYASQIERLFRSFAPAQVLVQQYEQCVDDSAAELRRTLEFLGADPDKGAPQFDRQVNTARQAKPSLSDHFAGLLRERYSGQMERLSELVPNLDLGRWSVVSGR